MASRELGGWMIGPFEIRDLRFVICEGLLIKFILPSLL
jgi:hypothetical protein